ncbi:hypothetical protein Pcinc_024192 [Petrolisthes cinctipes]|uniref:Uncharacterized protein n=1 Tax=Petrolisthes cinctipes TaxID=88211 RepID=A0AAE1KDD0_PETCI|nr:hypothetical protein Pcinc_024192 [Petrolisthes cinctipes]
MKREWEELLLTGVGKRPEEWEDAFLHVRVNVCTSVLLCVHEGCVLPPTDTRQLATPLSHHNSTLTPPPPNPTPPSSSSTSLGYSQGVLSHLLWSCVRLSVLLFM